MRRFLRRFVPTIGRMSRAVFSEKRDAAVSNKLRDDRSFADELGRSLGEIEGRQYVWDRAEREASEMRTIGQAELASWAKKMILGDGARMLSIHCHEGSCAEPEEQPMPAGKGATPLPAAELESFKGKQRVLRKRETPLPPLEVAYEKNV